MLLTHDHSELDELLAEFFPSLAARNVAQSFDKLDVFWARLAMHIRAEHLHLFPTLLHALSRNPRRKGAERAPSLETGEKTITRLREDHDFFMTELAAAITDLRKLRESAHADKSSVFQSVREKIIAVGERLKAHNDLEETEVYPLAEVLLTPAECVTLNEKMQKELDNVPQRFSNAAK